MNQNMQLKVNGKVQRVPYTPGDMLSDVLRYGMGLTGTKIGCDEAECGICTVLVNREPTLSCNLPAEKAEGCEVLTIEGLSVSGRLHPLQEAFIAKGTVQCGFCIPGQIMTAYALLETHPEPTETQIKYALKDTLCRCAGYPTIIHAVQAAAKKLRSGEPISPLPLEVTADTRVVGQLIPRPDAECKVTGKAMFTDDFVFPNMLHGSTLRARQPHAILKSLDIEKAQKLPGVHAVMTAVDIPGENSHGLVVYDWPVLVGIGERVRYVGDALALVAAETRAIAQQAIELIDFRLELLPVIDDPILASQPEAIQIHENGNLLKHIKVRKGDVEIGFREADLVYERSFQTPMTEHAFLEPECSLARPLEDGRVEVYVGSQIPYADRSQIARCLGVSESKVRVIGTLIGGGFGGKEDIAGQIHAALLATKTQRPVKILYDRHESLLVHPKRHATQIRVKMGVRRDGRILAALTELYGDSGAYASLGEKVMTRATTHSTGPYVIPNVKADCYAMYTNNPPSGAFRGFGVTQSCFAIESAMDEIAEELELDPVEFRRMNALREGTTTNTSQLLTESVGLLECIDRVIEVVQDSCPGAGPFESRQVEDAPQLRRAWGLAVAFKNTGLGGGAPDKASAEVELYPDGTAEVRTSSAEIGQGLVTVLQMIAAEELSLPPERVRVLLSDTDLTPDGGPTTASRQTYVTGNAVRHAALVMTQVVASTLAERYDQSPEQIRFVEGVAQWDGKSIPLGEAVEMMKAEGREPRATYEYWAPATDPLGTGGAMHFAYSFATQAAEVDVDLETGEVYVRNVVAANDVGRVINPLGLQGQVEGGIMMGLGNALTEEYIVEKGHVFTDRLARYRMPSIDQTPRIHSIVVEHPTAEGPYGAKGVGEISSIPTTPAITNAIYNACGIRVLSLPVDQDWLAREIAGLPNRD
jgi:xanthine dehydrogenase molybdenum-binding subunit